MTEKIKEALNVATTDDYAVLLSVKVPPQIGKMLFFLKEENANAVLFKIEGAQDESFVYVKELKAETLLAKDGVANKRIITSESVIPFLMFPCSFITIGSLWNKSVLVKIT